jgi:hypothetical protein
MSFDVLFALTVYRDGQVRFAGRPRGPLTEAVPAVLREIALAIEDGALILSEEDPADGFDPE